MAVDIEWSELTQAQKMMVKQLEEYYGKTAKIEYVTYSFVFDFETKKALLDTPPDTYFFGTLVSQNHIWCRCFNQYTPIDVGNVSHSNYGRFITGVTHNTPMLFQYLEMTSGAQSWGSLFMGLRISL